MLCRCLLQFATKSLKSFIFKESVVGDFAVLCLRLLQLGLLAEQSVAVHDMNKIPLRTSENLLTYLHSVSFAFQIQKLRWKRGRKSALLATRHKSVQDYITPCTYLSAYLGRHFSFLLLNGFECGLFIDIPFAEPSSDPELQLAQNESWLHRALFWMNASSPF